MKFLCWPLSVFAVFFLQGRLSVLGITPDFTALLVFSWGLRLGAVGGLFSGLAVGILEDGLTGSFIGPNMLSKGIIGYSASFFLSGGLFRWTPFFGLIAVSVFTLLDNAVSFAARSLFDRLPAAPANAFFIALMQSIMNAPAGMWVRPRNVD